ncbi:sugar transferase [Propionicicella superfundia]|uniref:sugar transferase n=1 Tax=Propionicicella superfundia TaxID=348582 RepID=UPI000686A4B2|nr:sugar transferase [Propionicicella superfundia]
MPDVATGRPAAYEAGKRVVDVVASALALVVLSPVVAAVAVLVAVRLGRPVVFRQERPGRGGELFTVVKFRTMLDVDESRGVVTNEQRMTPVGSWLRACSLDELPSLWNVLRGDMSLVGPRPLLPRYLPLFTPEQRRRHEVRPGLTGLAQVSGRNSLDWGRRLELDVHYVDHRCARLDAAILARTVLTVLRREGIRSEGCPVGEPFPGAGPGGVS